MPAENCRAVISKALEEYGLSECDNVAIRTDAAKVMVKMGRQAPFDHHQCMLHGLHLSVMDVLYSKESISVMQSMIDANDPVEVEMDED